jgi:drug/metabolite transporter (DMT)-like permease
MEYLYISLATFGIAGNFLLQKFYQKKYCKTFLSIVQLPLITSVFNLLYYFLLNKGQVHFGGYTMLMAFLYACCTTFNTIVGLIIMKYCPMALFSMFIMMGGMFLPFLVGAIFLNEPVSVYRIIAIIVLLVALAVISMEKNKNPISIKGLLLCFSVFIVNGLVSTISKLHQVNVQALSSVDFSFWITAITLLMTAIMNIVIIKKKQVINTEQDNGEQCISLRKHIFIHKVLLILAMSVVSCTGAICQQIGAKTIDAGMLFPMTSGGSIVLMTVFGAILYKEKLTKRQLIGLIIGVISIVFLCV